MESYLNDESSRGSSGPTSVNEDNFPSNHLMRVGLVRQKRNKQYQKPYFFFVSGIPRGKNGNDSTYIFEKAINFKMEIFHLMAFIKAVQVHAAGSAKNHAPYKSWADPSKSNYGGNQTTERVTKSLSIEDKPHSDGERGRIIMINFLEGQDRVSITYTPYEALAIVDSLASLVQQARELSKAEYVPAQPPARRPQADQGRGDQRQSPGRTDGPENGRAAPPRSTPPASSGPRPAGNAHQPGSNPRPAAGQGGNRQGGAPAQRPQSEQGRRDGVGSQPNPLPPTQGGQQTRQTQDRPPSAKRPPAPANGRSGLSPAFR